MTITRGPVDRNGFFIEVEIGDPIKGVDPWKDFWHPVCTWGVSATGLLGAAASVLFAAVMSVVVLVVSYWIAGVLP